jgi:hypothetical protein
MSLVRAPSCQAGPVGYHGQWRNYKREGGPFHLSTREGLQCCSGGERRDLLTVPTLDGPVTCIYIHTEREGERSGRERLGHGAIEPGFLPVRVTRCDGPVPRAAKVHTLLSPLSIERNNGSPSLVTNKKMKIYIKKKVALPQTPYKTPVGWGKGGTQCGGGCPRLLARFGSLDTNMAGFVMSWDQSVVSSNIPLLHDLCSCQQRIRRQGLVLSGYSKS